jgi:organic hydroperoxide reductase OsmC/OhrA
MSKTHRYQAQIVWTGNVGSGTSGYRAYERRYEVHCAGKTPIVGSSDPAFRGDPALYNPEDLLLAALSACHMLWYLHLCADAGIIVQAYEDNAEGSMTLTADGAGRFTEVLLRPNIRLAAGADADQAKRLHAGAHEKCFIANSVNFPIRVEPTILVER